MRGRSTVVNSHLVDRRRREVEGRTRRRPGSPASEAPGGGAHAREARGTSPLDPSRTPFRTAPGRGRGARGRRGAASRRRRVAGRGAPRRYGAREENRWDDPSVISVENVPVDSEPLQFIELVSARYSFAVSVLRRGVEIEGVKKCGQGDLSGGTNADRIGDRSYDVSGMSSVRPETKTGSRQGSNKDEDRDVDKGASRPRNGVVQEISQNTCGSDLADRSE